MTRDLHGERQPADADAVRAHSGHSLSLVGLPPHLRRRIYLYTGVARLDGHPYTYFLDGRRKSSRTRPVSDFDAPPTRNFAGLLRSCRALYVETAALLYSANRFVIFYSRQGSFKHLCALSPTSIASLTSLKIVLNESCHEPTDQSDHRPYCWCDGHAVDYWDANHHCAKYHGGQHRRPLLDPAPGSDLTALTSVKGQVQAMLGEWHDTVAHTSRHIGTGRLELFLVCDIDPEHPYALEAARLALAPIALFPRLRDCHIRLCKLPNYPIQQMAQKTVLQACGRPSSARLGPANPRISSALANLPPELRIRILEYTDLITPWKEVTWSRQDRGYQVVRALCASSSEGSCPTQNHNGCRISSCDPHLDLDGGYVPSYHCCFCRRRHAAFSFACKCWAPPTYLFLIDHALYRDAQFVFFSCNRFIVHDFHARQPWDLPPVQLEPGTPEDPNTAYPFERLAVSEFLRDIVPTYCLANLRFLELVFPPYVPPHGWPHSGHPALLDWVATVDWVRGHINAPALTLRVVMADFWCGPIVGRTAMTKALADNIIRGYSRITNPLKPLVRDDGGLAGFYMQVAHPARWTLDVLRRASLDEGFLARMHRNLNVQGERYVRGPGSNLDDPNRAEPSKSSWQRWYKTDPYGD